MTKKVQSKRKVPMRMCVGCRQRFEKRELIRILRAPDGEIKIDKKGKMSGRGAYICDKKVCLDKAIKTKALQRALEAEIDESILDALKEDINE